MTSHPQIYDTKSFSVASTVVMKEGIKKQHGYTKAKELFAFDGG